MKLLRFKESISGYGSPDKNTEGSFSFAPGDEVWIEDELGSAWVESGIATFISQVPVAEYAVVTKVSKQKQIAVPPVVEVVVEAEPTVEVQKEG
jgi:hypothetical protein